MRKVDKQEYELFCLHSEADGGCLASFDEKSKTEWRMNHQDEPIAYAQWHNGSATYYINDGSFR